MMSTEHHSDHRHTRDYVPSCAFGHDFLLPLYDSMQRLFGMPALHRAVVRAAQLRPGQRVLDVGCGTGSLLVELARQHPNTDVVGLDPDPQALAWARRKARRAGVSVHWDQGYAQRLPYPDDAFDVVFSTLMFHHLDPGAQGELLAETLRVLRPGGALLLADFDARGHIGIAHRVEGLHLHFAEGIPRRMREAGFVTVDEVTQWRRWFGQVTCWRATAPADPAAGGRPVSPAAERGRSHPVGGVDATTPPASASGERFIGGAERAA